MVFHYNKRITVESIKEWILQQLDDAVYLGENEESDEEEQSNVSNVIKYMISAGKYDVVDYLISIGVPYTDDDILLASDINFIKKYLDIANISSKYANNPSLLQYYEENDLLTTKYFIMLIKENYDVKLMQKYYTRLNNEEITSIMQRNLYEIFDKCNDEYKTTDLNLIKFVINSMGDNEELRTKLSPIFTDKIKTQFTSYNSCAIPAYGNYNAQTRQKYLRELIPMAVKHKLLDPNIKLFGTSDNKYPTTLFRESLKINFTVQQLESLIECDVDVNFIDNQGKNYLFWCINDSQTKFLLSKGLDPKHIDNLNQTPLFTVSEVSQVITLINAGTNPNIKSSIGETAYDKHYSCSESQYTFNNSTYKSICKELLKHVNINQKIMNPETKLSDLTVEDLITIIKLKSTQ